MNDSSSLNRRVPVVAIAGRPNVGKSTLFNRFVRSRKAITDPTPGVTRDPVEAVADVEGVAVRFIDTGGYKLDQEALDDLVVRRSLEIIKDADIVCLVLDLKEITSEDELFIEAMRPYTDKIILVVNKVDGPEKENEVWNYYSLGFNEIVPISATHGRGFDELSERIYERVSNLPGSGEVPEAADADVSISILGKPNTGKSTLINRLTGKESSIVSDIPGTTRDIVEGGFEFKGKQIKVLDTAGIRRKKKVSESVEYYSVNRAIKSIDSSDVIILMIDSAEGLTEQDKKIAGLIVKKGKGVVIALSKWDLQDKVPNALEAVSDRVRFLFPVLGFAPIVPVCAVEGTGIDELLDAVLKVKRQLETRVDTSMLNRHLAGWLEENEPPRWKNGRLRIKYMTQVSAAPVQFIAFVNRKKNIPESYQRYLIKMIRSDFGLSSIPLTLEFRD